MKLQPRTDSAGNPCCGDESWRGHLCQYHQGYDDGADALSDALVENERLLNQIYDMEREHAWPTMRTQP